MEHMDDCIIQTGRGSSDDFKNYKLCSIYTVFLTSSAKIILHIFLSEGLVMATVFTWMTESSQIHVTKILCVQKYQNYDIN